MRSFYMKIHIIVHLTDFIFGFIVFVRQAHVKNHSFILRHLEELFLSINRKSEKARIYHEKKEKERERDKPVFIKSCSPFLPIKFIQSSHLLSKFPFN